MEILRLMHLLHSFSWKASLKIWYCSTCMIQKLFSRKVSGGEMRWCWWNSLRRAAEAVTSVCLSCLLMIKTSYLNQISINNGVLSLSAGTFRAFYSQLPKAVLGGSHGSPCWALKSHSVTGGEDVVLLRSADQPCSFCISRVRWENATFDILLSYAAFHE